MTLAAQEEDKGLESSPDFPNYSESWVLSLDSR